MVINGLSIQNADAILLKKEGELEGGGLVLLSLK